MVIIVILYKGVKYESNILLHNSKLISLTGVIVGKYTAKIFPLCL
jgi:predicted ATP-grasp superfamily ATP-dependent carboligase